MTRAEARRAIEADGDLLVERVSRATSRIIVGDRGPQTRRDGGILTPLARARRLVAEGCAIDVLSENDWLATLPVFSSTAGVRRQFTAGQIAETLGVPRAAIDRWLAAGLVQPASDGPVPVFDFSQVVAARTLAELAAAGVSLAKIRRGLSQLQACLPTVARPLAELCLSEHSRRLAVRTPDGRLAETTGQLLMDFDASSPSPSAVPYARTESRKEAFRRAVAFEEDQRLAEAAEIYQIILDRDGPDAAVHFNLGNALYGLNDLFGAIEQYRGATELDPSHAGAWNNLGNILAELDRLPDAAEAHERALAINSSWPDAHFNLAQTLVELGREAEAALHWRAYLAFDPESAWADYARERLADLRAGGRASDETLEKFVALQ